MWGVLLLCTVCGGAARLPVVKAQGGSERGESLMSDGGAVWIRERVQLSISHSVWLMARVFNSL